MKLLIFFSIITYVQAQLVLENGKSCSVITQTTPMEEVIDLTPQFLGEDNSLFKRRENNRSTNNQWTLLTEEYIAAEALKYGVRRALDKAASVSNDSPPYCPDNTNKEEVIFAFEGFQAYNQKKFVLYKNFPFRNIDIEFLQFYCKREGYKEVLKQECDEVRKISSEQKWFNTGEGSETYPWIVDYLVGPYMAQDEFRDKKKVVYYRHDMAEAAFNCAQRMKLQGKKIKIVGYSYGGYAAVLLANKLNEVGIKVESFLAIDPVKHRNLNYILGPEMKATTNLINSYSVHQRNDNDSLAGIDGIRGQRLEGATSSSLLQEIKNKNTSDMRHLVWSFGQEVQTLNHIESGVTKKAQPTASLKGEDTAVEKNNDHFHILKDEITHNYFLKFLRD